jgi:toxin ParE1/3/4
VTAARVRFHRATREEAEAAVRWYDERVIGLGADFASEVERVVSLIAEAPTAWPVSRFDPRARQIPLARFPYSLVYVVQRTGDVVVAAVAHAKRRPGYWRGRLARSR